MLTHSNQVQGLRSTQGAEKLRQCELVGTLRSRLVTRYPYRIHYFVENAECLDRSHPTFCATSPRINTVRTRMQIALFQPDIPQNTGTILRLCACLDVRAHIIEPAGFPVSDRAFRRAGMDYLDQVTWMRHDSWARFEEWRRGEGFRLLLFTTKAAVSYLDFRYEPSDILLFGRETVGVTDEVVAAADARLKIPMKPYLRSLNVAMAAAMVVGEALRQTRLDVI